jgi:hypothetical protein
MVRDPLHTPRTFEQAHESAESAARSHLKHFLDDESAPLLDERYLEAEHCWMFFRNKAIALPPEQSLRTGAYVVSKRGNTRYIADFSEDPVMLEEYLVTMSNYFRDHGE